MSFFRRQSVFFPRKCHFFFEENVIFPHKSVHFSKRCEFSQKMRVFLIKFVDIRLPFNVRTPIGFIVGLFVGLCSTMTFIIVLGAFATLYVGVCSTIESCIREISLIAHRSNELIHRKIPIKENLQQLIELHLHCARYQLNIWLQQNSCR